jgi:hypothetical protein
MEEIEKVIANNFYVIVGFVVILTGLVYSVSRLLSLDLRVFAVWTFFSGIYLCFRFVSAFDGFLAFLLFILLVIVLPGLVWWLTEFLMSKFEVGRSILKKEK